MLLLRKDKRKLALQKGRTWNREIKFEPVLVFGTYGEGNARIRLWKPLTLDKPIGLNNANKRKRKNWNLPKARGKSQTSTTSRKILTKHLVNLNNQLKEINEKISNHEDLMKCSSDDRTNKFINDSVGEDKNIFKPYSTPVYLNENKECNVIDQFISPSETLKYVVDKPMILDLIGENFFSNNLIEYPKNIEEENNLFKTFTSSDYKNQNYEYVNKQIITETQALNNISDELMTSHLNSETASTKRDKGENNVFESLNSSDDKNINNVPISTQFKTLTEALKNYPDKLMKSHINNIATENIFTIDAKQFANDDERENKVSLHNSSKNKKQNVNDQFITEAEDFKRIPDKLMNSDLNNILNTENIFPDLIYPSTSHYNHLNSIEFNSLENLKSDSDNFYENIRKTWSLNSSKVLMTPSKGSIHEKNSLSSIGSDLIKIGQNPNSTGSKNTDLIQLLDAIDNDILNIILNHHRPEEILVSVKDEGDLILHDLRNHNPILDIVQLQDGINRSLNGNEILNNDDVKFIVLKKSRENQETILDSSEEIEKNIFTRNKISPGFENMNSNPTSIKEKTLLHETDNSVTSKLYSLDDILQKEVIKAKLPKVSQEPSRPIIEDENFSHSNSSILKDLVNNQNIQASEDNLQKPSRIASKYETLLQTGKDQDKNTSFVSMRAGEKYFDEISECSDLSISAVSSIDVPRKKTGDTIKNNKGRPTRFYNACIKNSKTASSSSFGSNETLSNKSTFHLSSKNHPKIDDRILRTSEIKKDTDEIINKITRAITNEELLELMKLNQKNSTMKSTDQNSLEEVSSTNFITVDKKDIKILYSQSTLESDEIVQGTFYSNNNISPSDSSFRILSNHQQTAVTPSCDEKYENEMPENFRIISEVKENSSPVMDLKRNPGSSDEKSTPDKDKNNTNTKLYYSSHIVNSPYDSPCPTNNMEVNVDERKTNLHEKFVNCFRKFNFWSKRKSVTSISGSKKDTSQ